MMRLFIATPLANEVEQKLAGIIEELKPHGGKIKYVAPHNIHLTLKFLGNTESDKVPALTSAIDKIATNYQPINSSLDNVGGFPNLRRPKVIWIGFKQNVEQLIKLVDDIEIQTARLGWEKENRKFKAHLTLGRVKDEHHLDGLTQFLLDYKIDPIPLTFDRIILFQSTLTQKGPIYKNLHEVILAERFG